MVIGVEGYVGSGKTSLCRELLKLIPNSVLLNGGNLYRAIVYAMMQKGDTIKDLVKKSSELNIKDMMDLYNINLRVENNETVCYMGDTKIDEDALQSAEVSLAVSNVGGKADNELLFEFARGLIDDLKKEHDVIIAGRALMVIYPNLDYHFMVTCDLEERVKRKLGQYLKDNHIDKYISEEEYDKQYKYVKANIMERDRLQDKAGFYKMYEGSITLDVTECKSAKESAKKLLTYINK